MCYSEIWKFGEVRSYGNCVISNDELEPSGHVYFLVGPQNGLVLAVVAFQELIEAEGPGSIPTTTHIFCFSFSRSACRAFF